MHRCVCVCVCLRITHCYDSLSRVFLLMADYPPLAFKLRLRDRRLSHFDVPHIKLTERLFTAARLLIAHQINGLRIRHGRLKGTYGFGQWPSKVYPPCCGFASAVTSSSTSRRLFSNNQPLKIKISCGHYFPFSVQEWQAYYTVHGIYEMIIFDGLDVRRWL